MCWIMGRPFDSIRYATKESTSEPVVIMRMAGDSVQQLSSICQRMKEESSPYLVNILDVIPENDLAYVLLAFLNDWIGCRGLLLLLFCDIHSESPFVERGGVERGRVLHSAWVEVAS